jgi:hypothetical protein
MSTEMGFFDNSQEPQETQWGPSTTAELPWNKSEAYSNAEANQRGTLGLMLEGKLDPSPRAPVRVKGDARANYEKGRQGTMGQLMGTSEQLSSDECPPAGRKQAGTNIRTTSNSSGVQNLFHNYGHLPQSARPEPRVKAEAKGNAMRNRGTMSEFM